MQRHEVTDSETLIALLLREVQGAKSSTIKKRIQSGAVSVNGKVVTKATTPLAPGDTVEFGGRSSAAPKTTAKTPTLYSDASLFIIDKPAGLLSVPGAGEREKTALAYSEKAVGASLSVVHRLDRETSGILVFARTAEDATALIAGWKRIEKTYLVVVENRPEADEGRVDLPLWEHPTSLRVHVGARDGARDAATRFVVEKAQKGRALLSVTLETGRKHQIRAHLAHLGCPIVGDSRYGQKDERGLMLHAHRLAFEHPKTGEATVVTSPIPARFRGALERRG